MTPTTYELLDPYNGCWAEPALGILTRTGGARVELEEACREEG